MADGRLEELSDLQVRILQVLWDRGESSAAEVREALEPDRRLAGSTVATLLARLERRGVVRRRQVGRNVLFDAGVAEEAVRRSMVSGLMSRLFGGDASALVSHLLTEGEIDPQELEALREEVKRARHRAGRRGKGGAS